MNSRELLKSSLFYTVVQYLVLGIGFVRGLFTAKYLGPALMGSYGLVTLILEYLRFSNLGISNAMNLEVSVNKNKAEKSAYVQNVINNAFSYMVVIALLLGAVAVVFHFFAPGFSAAEFSKYAFAIFFIGMVGQIKVFAVLYARLFDKYRFINLIELASAVVLCLLVVLFIADYQLNAVIGSMIASSLLTLSLCLVLIHRKVSLCIDWRLLRKLATIGIPLLLCVLFEKVFQTVDRMLIVRFLTREDLGFFTLAYTVLSNTLVVLSSFTFLNYPKFLERFNMSNYSGEARDRLWHDLKRYSTVYSGVIIAIALIGLILVEPFIKILLPAYGPSIPIYRILMIGSIFEMVSYFAGAYLVSNKHQNLILWMLAISTLTSLVLNYFAIHMGWGLVGIAVATSFSMSLYAALKIGFVLAKIGTFSLLRLTDFYKKYILLLAFVIPVLLWLPAHLYLVMPVFLVIYLSELLEVKRRLLPVKSR